MTPTERLNRLETWLASQPIGPITRHEIMSAVRAIAVEQDKVTRHACAEAVTIMPDPFTGPFPTAGDRCKSHGFDTAKQSAHQACMNVQAL